LICDDPDYAKQVVEEVFANREVSFPLACDLAQSPTTRWNLLGYILNNI